MKTKELIVSPIYNAKGNIVGQEYHGELIRCKDCVFYDSEQMCVALAWMHGKPIKIAKNADDYCSLAERKEE